MPADPLHALAISTDRLLLRRLTRLLDSIGCRVDQVAQPERAYSLLGATRPDFVIIDGDLAAESFQKLCEATVNEVDSGPPPVVLALIGRHDEAKVMASLAAGADDILHKPLVAGEVLARVRAAARLREQQWRRHLQLGHSDTLGCLPAAVWRALAAELARQHTGVGACVTIQIDHFQHLAAGHGRLRATHFRASIVDRLETAGGDGIVWGELDDDCLAALLTSSDDVAALAWAERLRAALVESPFELDGVAVHVTASMGVAALNECEATAEESARGALQLAQHSGRNCVVSAQEWQNECRRLNDEPSWLDSANAWDVMIPHPLALYADDTVEQAQLLMAQTQLAHIPIVDSAGKLQGIVSASSLQHDQRKTTARTSDSLRFVRAFMQGVPAQFDEETPVRKLQSHFASEPSQVAVITRHGRPLGLIYSDSLTLLEERLTRQTFAPRTPFSLDSAYLTTPEASAVTE
jgi:DNA-binding response OmpR family regulator/CBS domain-containing protein